MFQCQKCGTCCTLFHLFPENNFWRGELDSGDGTCRYFDRSSRLCTIYDSRPVICNNIRYYNEYLKDFMTRGEFDALLNEDCRKIRSDEI